jgi:hypothetical protein
VSGSSAVNGFAFTAPALIFNGQNIGGTFNFDLPVVAANSASDAYNFVGASTEAAYGFLGNSIANTDSYAYNLMTNQTAQLAQIGNIFAQTSKTAASKIATGSGGGLFGFLGL